MGWTETRFNNKLSHKERRLEMDTHYNWENDTKTIEVLKSSITNNTYYAAIKVTDKATGNYEVTGVVCLLSERKAGLWYWYGYKDMYETCGPYKYDCPISILKLLTPTDNEWANEWREKCWEKSKKPKLKELEQDTVIEFVCPYDTTYHKQGEVIRLVKRWSTKNLRTNRTTYKWVDTRDFVSWPTRMIPEDFVIIE